MAGNVVVTTTRNDVVFNVDKKSFNDAKAQIKKLKKEWEGVGQRATGRGAARDNPTQQLLTASKRMEMVNKRLAETRKREETKASQHRIALAKKEARATEAIQKQSAARIRQKMNSMTAKNPETAKMRKYYQQMERDAKKNARAAGSNANWTSPAKAGRLERLNALLASRSAAASGAANRGMAAGPEAIERARQNMLPVPFPPNAGPQRPRGPKAAPNTGPQLPRPSPKNINPEANNRARLEARASDAIATNAIRLRSKYGAGYETKLGTGAGTGGIGKLNAELKAGKISVSQYRAHLGSLEAQLRSNQRAALSFGDALKDVRSSLVGVGAAYGVFNAGKSVLKQGQFFQGLNATMLMTSDSPEEAAQREKFIKDQAYRLGLDLPKASEGYTQMSISGQGQITKQQTNDLFTGYSEYATALQVDPVKYQRGITAIGQMLGKGQIMAEELKQQLAEGIPGSLQVFVKASQEAFNDTSIDVEKLMDKMQKGELKAAKVLPFVAKYYAEAARKGGALNKALEGNRVAMQRMNQTWINFQNDIFQGGFGEQMTKIFNDLAKVLSENGELAKNMGKFFGKMIEGAWNMVTYVHDAFVLFSRILDHYIEEWGVKGETMDKIFDWGAYILGIVIFTSFVAKLFGWLTKIAGLAGALGAVKDAVTTMGKGGGAAGGGKGVKGGKGFSVGLPAWIAAASLAGQVSEAQSDMPAFLQKVQDNNNRPTMWTDITDWWGDLQGKKEDRRAEYLRAAGLDQVGYQASNPFPSKLPTQQVEGDVTIKIDAGELQKYVKAVVDEQNGFNFNLLTGGGN
ncbi:tape measure protein [Serratia phage vB_SmaM-ChuuTotoro]|nr:tape measure protein [Serratia phage vB_SmaM-ChuuTotoro]